MALLVDTNIFLSIIYNERSSEKAAKILAAHKGNIKISTMTTAELIASTFKKAPELTMTAKALIEAFVARENFIPVDNAIAETAGKLKAKYSPDLSMADCIILATALKENCEAVFTADPEFNMVSEIGIMKL